MLQQSVLVVVKVNSIHLGDSSGSGSGRSNLTILIMDGPLHSRGIVSNQKIFQRRVVSSSSSSI